MTLMPLRLRHWYAIIDDIFAITPLRAFTLIIAITNIIDDITPLYSIISILPLSISLIIIRHYWHYSMPLTFRILFIDAITTLFSLLLFIIRHDYAIDIDIYIIILWRIYAIYIYIYILWRVWSIYNTLSRHYWLRWHWH
jgi:hypothetical protein